MKKIYQTRFLNEGNCFPACLASLLEVELEQVDFTAKGDNWMFENMYPVLDKLGYVYLEFDLENMKNISLPFIPEGFLFIATGKTLRGVFNHSVIMQTVYKNKIDCNDGYEFILIHDPYPDPPGEGGLETIEQLGFLIDKKIHQINFYNIKLLN